MLAWLQQVFGRLFQTQQPAQTGAQKADFAYFPSAEEAPGFEAIPRKREIESRLQTLEALPALSPEQAAERSQLLKEQQSLLQHAPFMRSESAQPQQESAAVDPALKDWVSAPAQIQRVLLIEDDPSVSGLIRYLLEHSQFVVTVINNGNQAKQWIQTQTPPQLISLDIMLPHCDGLELVQLIRQQPGWERVPILMLTSKSDQPTIQQALQLGANDYLSKPFQPEEYLARVGHLLN
jgi:CheY-like chemotaxis protein